MPLDKSRRPYYHLILVEIASRYDVTRRRCFITPAWFFIVELCKRGFRVRYIQFRPLIEIRFEAAFARCNELCAVFAFPILEDRVRSAYPVSLIGKFIGVGIKYHNMRIAATEGLHERGLSIGNDRYNRIARPFSELGGNH